MNKTNLGILISGQGSNMEAIINACKDDSYPARVAIVIADNKDAKGLQIAKKENIPTKVFLRSNFENKNSFETEIVSSLNEYNVNLVCLAGFMRIIGKTILNTYPNKVLNIHPSLLPSFPGLDAQKQAFDYGVKQSGCTVHFVDNKIDHGPIILQKSVPVELNDTEQSLAARILEQEHLVYPKAIQLFSEGRLRIDGRKVYIDKQR